jgi:hypothetical protein
MRSQGLLVSLNFRRLSMSDFEGSFVTALSIESRISIRNSGECLNVCGPGPRECDRGNSATAGNASLAATCQIKTMASRSHSALVMAALLTELNSIQEGVNPTTEEPEWVRILSEDGWSYLIPRKTAMHSGFLKRSLTSGFVEADANTCKLPYR